MDTIFRSTDPDVYMVDLLVDDNTALATPEQFHRLMEYSTTLPTGKYHGKRWKREVYKKNPDGSWVPDGWILLEYFETPELTLTNMIGIRSRELFVVE